MAENIPTICHSFWPTLMVLPTSRPANARAAPEPTITSLRPVAKRRPASIRMFPRTSNAPCSTPRKGTLASVPVLRFGRLMMTNNSAELSGPAALRATPGASPIVRMASRSRPLVISLSEPLRSTTATSGEPDTVIARRNPSAIASTPTSTPTTPAIPTAAVSAAALRSGSERRLYQATEND